MSILFILTAALLPAIALLYYIWKKDTQKEPEVRKADVSTELELPLSPARLRISPTSPLIGAMPQPRSYPPAIL